MVSGLPTLITLSFYAHYSAPIHFLPTSFGTYIIMSLIQCKFCWILLEFIFLSLPELKLIFQELSNNKYIRSINKKYTFFVTEAECPLLFTVETIQRLYDTVWISPLRMLSDVLIDPIGQPTIPSVIQSLQDPFKMNRRERERERERGRRKFCYPVY